MRNYRFANGEEKLSLSCDAYGRWLSNGIEWDRMQSCDRKIKPFFWQL